MTTCHDNSIKRENLSQKLQTEKKLVSLITNSNKDSLAEAQMAIREQSFLYAEQQR